MSHNTGNWQEEIGNLARKAKLAYALARHIRNTDKMPPIEWGAKGGELLIELRELDPARYDREVKHGK